jgi:hypothetical protein
MALLVLYPVKTSEPLKQLLDTSSHASIGIVPKSTVNDVEVNELLPKRSWVTFGSCGGKHCQTVEMSLRNALKRMSNTAILEKFKIVLVVQSSEKIN